MVPSVADVEDGAEDGGGDEGDDVDADDPVVVGAEPVVPPVPAVVVAPVVEPQAVAASKSAINVTTVAAAVRAVKGRLTATSSDLSTSVGSCRRQSTRGGPWLCETPC